MTLALSTIDKLGKLFPRLGSDHDGEVIATARAIIRTLASSGATLHDLSAELHPKVRVEERVVYRDAPKPKTGRKAKKQPAPEPPPQDQNARGKFVPAEEITRLGPQMIDDCDLNSREIDFLKQLIEWAKAYGERLTLTSKQAAWWQRLLLENDFITPEGQPK